MGRMDGPDGWAYYWHDMRTEPKVFSKRQSGGGSVMVWGAICYIKKVQLQFINNTGLRHFCGLKFEYVV